jgi:hypothetical protein
MVRHTKENKIQYDEWMRLHFVLGMLSTGKNYQKTISIQ